MSDRPESLAAALAELQQHLPRIGKDSAAVVETKTGRTYGYKYADLATISAILLPRMAELGLCWTCLPTMHEGQFVLEYTLEHVQAGRLQGRYPLPSSTPQTMGGAITYARRYCLLAVTGAAPDEDDDDAQAAEAAEQAARAQRNAPPEVREDGSATDAELTRMNRGHEPGAWRSTSTAENDGWYERPASQAIEDQPGTSLKEQRQGIYIALGKHGIKDHQAAVELLLRHDIDSPHDMSYNEAVSVRARVDSWDGRTEELLTPLVVRLKVAADDGMAEDS